MLCLIPYSNTKKRVVPLDEILEESEEQRIEVLERDMFGDDDNMCYYDYVEHNDWYIMLLMELSALKHCNSIYYKSQIRSILQ